MLANALPGVVIMQALKGDPGRLPSARVFFVCIVSLNKRRLHRIMIVIAKKKRGVYSGLAGHLTSIDTVFNGI